MSVSGIPGGEKGFGPGTAREAESCAVGRLENELVSIRPIARMPEWPGIEFSAPRPDPIPNQDESPWSRTKGVSTLMGRLGSLEESHPPRLTSLAEEPLASRQAVSRILHGWGIKRGKGGPMKTMILEPGSASPAALLSGADRYGTCEAAVGPQGPGFGLPAVRGLAGNLVCLRLYRQAI